MKTWIILIFFLFALQPLSSQIFLNLDFEYPEFQKQTPKHWNLGGEGYTFHLDSLIKSKGRYSLRVSSGEQITGNSYATCTGNFPVDAARGKRLLIKGKIKTQGIEKGAAMLWCRVDGIDGMLAYENMKEPPVRGDADWTEATIELKVDEQVKNINFGASLVGKGIAWFDDIEAFIDGERYLDTPPILRGPTEQEILWLAEHVRPLKSYDPEYEEDEDLAVLQKMIGDARIVGLGEVTHGSKEIFKMKHRLVRYLRENMGFDTFSIEANMPEAYRLNDYTLRGVVDPAELIRGMYFWTWRTQEVLDMVNWMKAHNDASPKKIRFTGFDMQYYEWSLEVLKKLTGKEAETTISKMEVTLRDIREKRRANRGRYLPDSEEETRMQEYLSELRNWIEAQVEAEKDKAWGMQNVRLIEQYLYYQDFLKRDQYMAENVAWIAQQNPDSKIVLWAHNGHIQESDSRMGQYLDRQFGEDYVSIGFAFHEGAYTAWGANGLATFPAEPSYPGTYEYFFQSIEKPIFLLDLREASREEPAARWIFQNLEFRHTGAVATPDEFQETALYDDFDMIIFINTSSSSKLLGE
jgi:erythromycin esterase